jgi:hypothetical protein
MNAQTEKENRKERGEERHGENWREEPTISIFSPEGDVVCSGIPLSASFYCVKKYFNM